MFFLYDALQMTQKMFYESVLSVQRYTYVRAFLATPFYTTKVLIVWMWMDDYTQYLLYVFSNKIYKLIKMHERHDN